MDLSGSRRLRKLYAAHSAWLGRQLAFGFVVHLAPKFTLRFPGFRRPVELHTALADIFEKYLDEEGRALPEEEWGVIACRARLMECAHAVVRGRLIRAISAAAAFDWPLAREAP